MTSEPIEPDDEESAFTQGMIEIRLDYPRDFILFCASFADRRTTHQATSKKFKEWVWNSELDDQMQSAVLLPKMTFNLLPTAQLEDFYHFVEHARLPEEIERRCFQSEMVYQLLAEGAEELTFFSSFWAALVSGAFYLSDIPAALIDAYYSAAYSTETALWRFQAEGVPLAEQFLEVTGFPDEQTNLLTMKTRGMRRFGLPELEFDHVARDVAPDVARLLRGVAQYIWFTVERIVPSETVLKLSEELDLPVSVCHISESAGSETRRSLIPVSLSMGESEHGVAPLIVAAPTEFETEQEWFRTIVPLLRGTG